MKKRIFRSDVFILCLMVLLCVLFTDRIVFAQSGDDLIKKAEGELRRSNSKLLSGRYKDVYKMLEETDKTIAAAQKADPGHARLEKVIENFMKQKERVEEKLGQKLTISFNPSVKQQTESTTPAKAAAATSTTIATTAAGATAAPSSPKSSPAEKLPYAARKPMQQFNNAYNSFDGNYSRFSESDADMQSSLMKRMGNGLESMKTYLESAKKEAAKKGVTAHPDFDDAENKISEAEKNYAVLNQSFQQQVAVQKAQGEKIDADSEGIKKLYNQLRDQIFDKATGVAMYYNKPSEAEQLLKDIEKFEKSDKAPVEQTLADFAAKYGDSEDAIKKSTGDWQTANSYMEIKNGIANVAKTRDAMAVDLIKKYERSFSSMAGTSDFYKVEYAANLKQYIDLALRYSPDNAEAKKASNEYQSRIDADLKSFYAKIDKRKWPAHSSNAPSNSDELADAALDWFKNDPGWGKRDQNPEAKEDKQARKPLAVSVKGPWSVQKRNLLGNPIMYGLPVLIAVEVPNEKSLNLVRVYDVTMRTAEKAGVKEEPPFYSITVGSSYYIRPSAL